MNVGASFLILMFIRKKKKKTYCGWKKCLFFRQGVLILELLSFYFPTPFHLLREENFSLLFLKLNVPFFMRCSQCFIYLSLSVLYPVYFVVRCCDICGVLMYLFILFQLCRISNEKRKKQSQPTPLCIYSCFRLKKKNLFPKAVRRSEGEGSSSFLS